jgi:hypothetical protein
MKKLACLLIFLAFLLCPIFTWAVNSVEGGTNTWIIDTVGAAAIPWGSVDIIWIMWTGCTTNGHDLEVRESSGGRIIIIDDDGEAGIPHFYPALGTYEGIFITTIDSGRLILKVHNPRWGKRAPY